MFETVEDDYTNWLKMQIRNIEYQRLRKIEMSEEIYTLLQETVIYDFEWMRRMSKCMKKL